MIRAKGEAEAAATQAKALAEAEGILKKAEAMKQYGEAATMNMQIEALKVYFEQLPAIAEAVAKPMSQIDTITMYGEGNTAKLTGDITKTITQVTSGLKDAGIDISAILSGMLGGSLVGKRNSNDENTGVEEAPKAVKIPTVVTPNLYTE
jgi:flotillin